MQTGKIVFKASFITLLVFGILESGCNQQADVLSQSKDANMSNMPGSSSSASSPFSSSVSGEAVLLNSTLVSINQSFNSSEAYQLSHDDIAFLKSEAGLSDEELASLGLFVKN